MHGQVRCRAQLIFIMVHYEPKMFYIVSNRPVANRGQHDILSWAVFTVVFDEYRPIMRRLGY